MFAKLKIIPTFAPLLKNKATLKRVLERWTSFYISRGECVEIGHMAYAVANLKAGKEITD